MKKIVFFADAIGQALNCVTLAKACQQQGYDCTLIADQSFADLFAQYALPYYLLNIHQQTLAGEVWSQHVANHLAHFRLSTLEQIEHYIIPYFSDIVDSSIQANAQLQQALDELQPDLICVDDVVLYPAIKQYPCPWIRIISCNETEVSDPNLPPQLSGYSAKDKTHWALFTTHLKQQLLPIQERFNAFLSDCGETPYPLGQILETSSDMNFFIYPESVRYERSVTLDPERFIYLNGLVRENESYQIPDFGINNDKPLIYISYGSMGAADVDLIKTQINAFANQPYRVLINVGDQLSSYETVASNIHLAAFFPQASVIQQADLVIYHGGNNTFNEILFYGKPSIVMPFAWDGPDNARRTEELELGLFLSRYNTLNKVLLESAQDLLSNKKIADKLKHISHTMQQKPGVLQAITAIKKLLEQTN